MCTVLYHRLATQLQLTNIYHIIYHIISHIIISHIISYHIISYHIISYHIISYHIISYRIISYHIISYIISYHTLQTKIYTLMKDIFYVECDAVSLCKEVQNFGGTYCFHLRGVKLIKSVKLITSRDSVPFNVYVHSTCFRFPMVSLEFFIDIILPAAL